MPIKEDVNCGDVIRLDESLIIEGYQNGFVRLGQVDMDWCDEPNDIFESQYVERGVAKVELNIWSENMDRLNEIFNGHINNMVGRHIAVMQVLSTPWEEMEQDNVEI